MDLIEHAASLLEADPMLAPLIGAAGHSRVLPVLTLTPGPWQPPAPEFLGVQTTALVVLSGLLAGAGSIAGPGDVVQPWEGAWTAWTPVRLAVIGERFERELQDWPRAARRLLARAVPAESWRRHAGADVRAEALLWHLAARWGRPHPAGVQLPAGVDGAVLAALSGLEAPEVAALLSRERVELREPEGWVLTGAAAPSLSDELRLRSAGSLARARATCGQYVAVLSQLQG